VRCPDGRDFLVDTGSASDAVGPAGLPAGLRRAGVRRLAGIVLSHGDEDHCGGIEAVARSTDVSEVVYPCPSEGLHPLSGILDRLESEGIRSRCVVAGMDALAGCGDGSPILWPPPGVPRTPNAASLVFRITAEGRSLLLSGDLEAPEEQMLAGSGADLDADVLKLGHHGSRHSSSPEFLEAVHPSVVVVSGFPTRTRRELPEETLERVATTGARLVSTARNGDVTVLLKADGVVVRGSRPH
jgi:beta-lactamase superfamily II metal-dependent hydrolase